MPSQPDTMCPTSFLAQGAIIQTFTIAGHNIVLSFPAPDLYKTHSPYFGETIGRVLNRISNARINSLNGRSYTLTANNGPNCLHGGSEGWGKKMFDGPRTASRNGKAATMFKYLSKDGEEGFPGAVECRVWYATSEEKGTVILDVEYEVEMVGKESEEEGIYETVVAVTNHSYFNLNGGDTITGTEIIFPSTLHLPIDSSQIPTGEITAFPGIPEDKPFSLGAQNPSIDHCFIVNANPQSVPIDTRPLPLETLVSLYHPDSKIHLRIESTEPAFQFFTGEAIDVPAVGGAKARGPRSGIAVEPGRYVNAVNHESWKNMVLLKRGEIWGSRSRYTTWKD